VLYTNAPLNNAIHTHLVEIVVKPYKDVFIDAKSVSGAVGVDPRCNKALYDLLTTKVLSYQYDSFTLLSIAYLIII